MHYHPRRLLLKRRKRGSFDDKDNDDESRDQPRHIFAFTWCHSGPHVPPIIAPRFREQAAMTGVCAMMRSWWRSVPWTSTEEHRVGDC